MEERRDMRASDSDRQAVVERLRSALDEGRLNLFEYDERLARAYQSVTYGDLAELFVDLPTSGTVTKREAASVPTAPKRAAGRRGAVADLPLPLKILWTIWLSVMAINLTVWLLVSLSNDTPDSFWPMWFLVPGAALLGVTLGVTAIRRNRRAAGVRRGIEAARRDKRR